MKYFLLSIFVLLMLSFTGCGEGDTEEKDEDLSGSDNNSSITDDEIGQNDESPVTDEENDTTIAEDKDSTTTNPDYDETTTDQDKEIITEEETDNEIISDNDSAVSDEVIEIDEDVIWQDDEVIDEDNEVISDEDISDEPYAEPAPYGYLNANFKSEFTFDSAQADSEDYIKGHAEGINREKAFSGNYGNTYLIPGETATQFINYAMHITDATTPYIMTYQYAANAKNEAVAPDVFLVFPTDQIKTGDYNANFEENGVQIMILNQTENCVLAIAANGKINVSRAENITAKDNGKLTFTGKEIPLYHPTNTPYGDIAEDLATAMNTKVCPMIFTGDKLCGNNIKETGETCDTQVISCADISGKNFTSGTAQCNKLCNGWDESSCIIDIPEGCGNGELNEGEICDITSESSAIGGKEIECSVLDVEKYISGKAACKADCSGYIIDSCETPHCGNGTVEADKNEKCDGGSIDCSGIEGKNYAGGFAACKTDCTAYDESTCSVFTKYTVASNMEGTAFANIEDIDGDGQNDLIVSTFGTLMGMKGEVIVYYNENNGSLETNSWSSEKVVSTSKNICFPNATQTYDIDDDGDMDIFVPSGFLACAANPLASSKWGLQWYENTTEGWVTHDVVPLGTKVGGENIFYHKVIFEDLDNDGIKDIITVGEIKTAGLFSSKEYAEVYWFKGNEIQNGDKNTRFDKTPRKIGNGGGSLPIAYDLTGDGHLDIISAQYFGYKNDPASFVWFENKGNVSDENNWVKHRINEADAGVSIQISFVENLHGDGIMKAIAANHTNSTSHKDWPHEAVYELDIPSDPTGFWPMEVIADEMKSRSNPMTGGEQGAPGVFHYGDIDNDGDIDIIVSGDGDHNVYWIEQHEGTWTTRIFDGPNGFSGDELGQAGVRVGDLDGDTIPEVIVSTYDGKSIYAYKLQKSN